MQLKELINKYNIFFFIIILILLYLTNNHFDYAQTLIFGGADGGSYLSISEDSPLITLKKNSTSAFRKVFLPICYRNNFKNIKYRNFFSLQNFCFNYFIFNKFISFQNPSIVES